MSQFFPTFAADWHTLCVLFTLLLTLLLFSFVFFSYYFSTNDEFCAIVWPRQLCCWSAMNLFKIDWTERYMPITWKTKLFVIAANGFGAYRHHMHCNIIVNSSWEQHALMDSVFKTRILTTTRNPTYQQTKSIRIATIECTDGIVNTVDATHFQLNNKINIRISPSLNRIVLVAGRFICSLHECIALVSF